MRRALFAGACALLATSCAAVLGLRDITEGAAEEPTESEAGSDAAPDAKPGDPADAGSIDCLGKTRRAYFCDGFEAPALAPEWKPDTTDGGDGTFEPTTRQMMPGSTQSGVSDIPGGVGSGGTESARVRWQRPDEGRRLAYQFHVFLDTDAWDKGSQVPFASVFDGKSEGKVVFTASGTGSNGTLSFQVGSQSIDLGTIIEKTWTCIELVADGTGIMAFVDGTTPKGSLPNLTGLTGVALGMVTDLRGKDFYYDNVILAPDAIGCP